LLLSHFLERAEKHYPSREIVSRTAKGIHRTNYADVARRVRRLATGLDKLGVKPGDRVGTFAWNHYRHLELYFALTGSGRVPETRNIRLLPEQVTFIANHAEDRVIFVDDCLIPMLEKVSAELKTVEAYVVMGDDVPATTKLAPLVRYEDLLAGGSEDYEF